RHLYALHDVSEQKKMRTRLAVSDRMASAGTLSAGLVHEINNPLAILLGHLEMLAELAVEPEIALKKERILELSSAADEAAQRIRQVVKDLKVYSRPNGSNKSMVNLKTVMESSLRLAWNEIRHRARV